MSDELLLEQWALDDAETARQLGTNHYDLTGEVRAESFFRDAFRIMRDALGYDWIARELDPALPSGYLLLGANSDEDSSTRIERSHRVANLALALHDARHIRGFEHLTAELRRRRLDEAIAELRAINHMRRAGQDAWFVDARERVGHTYDAVVVLSGIEVAVEVKTKLSQPVDAFRPNLIENSLRSARKQLPKSAPSLIYLCLSPPWTEDVATMRATDEVIRRWLRTTGRVNGVHVLLERTFTLPAGGTRFSQGSTFIPNQVVRYPVPDLQS